MLPYGKETAQMQIFSAVNKQTIKNLLKYSVFLIGKRRLCVFTRGANLILATFQTAFKPSYAIARPVKLVIDIGNICNLRCVLCPVGQKRDGRAMGFMPFEDFKRIVDEAEPYTIFIDLYNWGEPLLNKDIFRMISYAHEKGFITAISSSLVHLDEDMAEALISSGLDILIVSLDGVSQETAERYQVGADFAKVMSHIKLIVDKKRELSKRAPFIQWRFIVTKYNEHEIPQAEILAKGIGVNKLEICGIYCDMGEMLFWDNEAQFQNVKEWLPEDERYSVYDYTKRKRKNIPKNKCSYLWNQMMINWNGLVSPCCALWYEKYDFGNVLAHSIKEIWNNEKYRAARKVIRGGKESDVKTICHICKGNNAML